MRILSLGIAALLGLASVAWASESKSLVVHEWGTFTSLQDESGRALGALNVDDEPLPKFVHRIRTNLVVNGGDEDLFSKSFPAAYPDVTMRLETPVLYFYPPAGGATVPPIDVTATFHGGVLSEFYPAAQSKLANADGPRGSLRIGDDTTGTLTWKNVEIGGGDERQFPATPSHVWKTPRQAAATPVRVGGESEKYLFYRGLGHVESPVRVIASDGGKRIVLQDNVRIDPRAQRATAALTGVWLCDFRDDGAVAFRAYEQVVPSSPLAKPQAYDATFADGDYSMDNVARLRASMKAGLEKEGLFADEAEAMLETWKTSYFKSGGRRLFYIVPRGWTDRVLPLTLSRPAELTRVMVGRIELVTPAQRKTLARFSRVMSPAAPLAEWYGTLGRFRAALLIDQLRREPNPHILGFAAANGVPPAALGLPDAPAAPAAPPATQPVSVANGATPPVVLLKR